MTPAQIAEALGRDPEMLERVARMLAPKAPERIASPDDAARAVRPYLDGCRDERLIAVYIDRQLRPLGIVTLTVGNDQYALVCPRQIYRRALQLDAAYVILAHNHPSGEVIPSHQDLEVTRKVLAAGVQIGIPLVDHIIIGGGSHSSLATMGHCVQTGLPVAYTMP